MKLVYRGNSYEYNAPQVAVEPGELKGKFRGLDWRFHNLKKPMLMQPPVNLTYRGVNYNNRPTSNQDQTTANNSVQEKARYQFIKNARANNNRTASMSSRTANQLGLA